MCLDSSSSSNNNNNNSLEQEKEDERKTQPVGGVNEPWDADLSTRGESSEICALCLAIVSFCDADVAFRA